MKKTMRNNLKRQITSSLLIGCLNGHAYAEQSVGDLLELSPAELADIPVSIARALPSRYPNQRR